MKQLGALGYPGSAIHRSVKDGRLHRLHRGVYAVGHERLTRSGRWMAAVIACGSDAVLSHRHAAALHQLRPMPATPIEATGPGHSKRKVDGVHFHAVRALDREDVTNVDGIPVTTVARTLLDLAEIVHPQQLRLALEASERLELFDLHAVEAVIARNPGRHGRKPLFEALDDITGPPALTRSELERQFLAFIRGQGLPEPQVNVVVAGLTVDCFWPEQRLVAELDGYGFHRTRAQFEEDRRRDAILQVDGVRVIRPTERRIIHDGPALSGELRRLLSPRAPWGAADPDLSAGGGAGR